MSAVVTVAINNYNYGRFVGRAIQSALAQTWPDVDVVVVDDGSTDDSWTRIEAFGQRIVAVRQRNGGQAAAYNAGFARATGNWILFLDADDELAPDAIATCMQHAQADVAKVHFPLRRVDREGLPVGGEVPYVLHEGDVSGIVRRFGSYGGPPASGNLYRREAIACCFPIPEAAWRIDADTVPFVIAAFRGRVARVERPLGNYRLHNRDQQDGVVGNMRRQLASAARTFERRRDRALELLAERTGIRVEGPFLPVPTACRTRAMSWRLTPQEHPYAGDTRHRLLQLQRAALREWPGYTAFDRLLQQAWLRLFLGAPQALARRLARADASGRSSHWVKRLTVKRLRPSG
jgi:glycosyltransferase involved in cell wall biosynthesis